MRLRYGISMWNYGAYTEPATLEDAVAEVRRSGYGVEVWPSWKDQENLFAPQNRSRLVRLLKGISSSLHGGRADTFEEHKIQIEAARDSESSVIVLHADYLRPDDHSVDFGLTREVVAYARENGVTVALENTSGAGSLDGVSRALEAVEGLKACLDVGHVYALHDHPLREYLQRLARSLAHIHLQDVYFVPGTRRAKDDTHRTPGQCDIPLSDWQLLLAALRNINFGGLAVIEVRPFTPTEIASQAREFLDSIG